MSIKKNNYLLVAIIGVTILFVVLISSATAPTVPEFSKYTEGTERKAKFFSYFQPLIDQHNQSIYSLRGRLQTWYDNRKDLSWFANSQVKKIARDYGMKKFDINNKKHWDRLFMRVDIVPTSLALAQAAMESAWGTSRFARNVNNYFGQWCFSKNCGLVPINREPGANHEVKGFDTPQDAVISYVHNLNTHRAYKEFRELRAQLRNEDKPVTGMVLASGLTHYSQRGSAYIKELQSLIKSNELSIYD